MQIALKAFLWRRVNKASIDSLLGNSKGQYHITLPDREYSDFFRGLARFDETPRGGFAMKVPIEAFTGSDPIGPCDLEVSYLGEDSARRDWNIRSQRPTTAYPLWREGRGFVTAETIGKHDFLIIARDVSDAFHARWIRTADFQLLPARMRESMTKNDAGWIML